MVGAHWLLALIALGVRHMHASVILASTPRVSPSPTSSGFSQQECCRINYSAGMHISQHYARQTKIRDRLLRVWHEVQSRAAALDQGKRRVVERAKIIRLPKTGSSEAMITTTPAQHTGPT